MTAAKSNRPPPTHPGKESPDEYSTIEYRPSASQRSGQRVTETVKTHQPGEDGNRMTNLVYFSSVSENTHRFVEKLGIPATRIPLHGRIEVDEPYVLVLPTYGGGRATPNINDGGYVPKQVIAFLNNEHNRSLIRGVIAAGNNNFGAEFAYAGNVVASKCGVPYLYRFELMGTPDDVAAVRAGLEDFWKDQTCHQPSQLQSL